MLLKHPCTFMHKIKFPDSSSTMQVYTILWILMSLLNEKWHNPYSTYCVMSIVILVPHVYMYYHNTPWLSHTHTHTHMTAKAASSRNYFRQLLAGTHTGRYVDEQSLKATYVGSACCPNLDGKEFHHPFILISCLGLHAIPRMHTCTHVNCKASKLFGFLAFWHQLFWL